jgi:acetyl esterase/lipase
MPRLWRHFARLLFAAGLLLSCHRNASNESKPTKGEASELRLWPGVAPGSLGLELKEVATERSLNPQQHDRAITGVLKPSLTPYLPEHPNGSALIVAVGGAYVREAWDKEGVDTARLFVSQGVTVFLLKYRLPGEGHQHRSDVPLQDGQRAVRLVRARAASFQLDPARIGVMGFSAGGHLASLLGSKFADKVYDPVDAADNLSARPDFVILLYPVVSMEDPIAHALSRRSLLGENPSEQARIAYSADRAVTRNNPATLLILAGDDSAVLPENSLRYYRALSAAGVSAELHVYERGGHGFALRSPKGSAVDGWGELAAKWMSRRGS